MNGHVEGRSYVIVSGRDGQPDAECFDGGSDCLAAELRLSKVTLFHDLKLQKATIEINAILKDLRDTTPEDRELVFLITDKGLLLARASMSAISRKDEKRLAEVLGTSQQASSA